MNLGLSIPMYNEEGNAERVVIRIVSHLERLNIDFLLAVVNNGSSDGTGTILDKLSEADARIVPIHLQRNQGYGGGIMAGVNALLIKEPDIIGWIWGDGQVCSTVLSTLYTECANGTDLAKTCRIQRQDGYLRRCISTVYSINMRTLMRVRTPDINGCPKLFRREFFSQLQLESKDWFLDAEAILKTEKKQGIIHNEPVIMEARTSGKSNVRMATIVEFLSNMIRWKMKRY